MWHVSSPARVLGDLTRLLGAQTNTVPARSLGFVEGVARAVDQRVERFVRLAQGDAATQRGVELAPLERNAGAFDRVADALELFLEAWSRRIPNERTELLAAEP